MTSLILLTLLALAPAAFTWWNGRTLLAFLDDPALPERLMANRGRAAFIAAFCLALMATFGFAHLFWSVPLLVVARMAAGYRIRKALYGDVWGLRGYLSFFSRLVFASYGFWVALALMPAIGAVAGSRDWVAGGLLAAVLCAWSSAYSRVFAAIMRGKPVEDHAIVSRFARLVEQCGLKNVSLKQVDMRGGVFANAVALPSVSHPAVLVSSTLVERLDVDETTAILGHELAHLEHYNPRVLRGLTRVTWTLIGAGMLLAPLSRLIVPDERGTLSMIWPAAVIVTLAFRARHRQQHETDSDLRALALTGNPDALIRALTKLHAFARIPRRWDTDVEQHASHPSLARRIQAIRKAAGGEAGEPLSESATFAGVDGTRSVTFHGDRVEFTEGTAGAHSIGYGLLTTLRVEARASAAPQLVAVDAARHRWSLPLLRDDLARVQATLDIVDSRLCAPRSSPVSAALSRLVAIVAVSVALLGGQIAVALVAWIAMLQPGSPLVGGAGAAAFAAAGLMWRDRFASMHPDALIAIALLASGVVLLVLQARSHAAEPTRRDRMLTAALAIAAAAAWVLMLSSGADALTLHRGARAWPAAAVLTIGLAGALAFSRSVKVRCAAAPLAAAGCAAMFLGSTTFLTWFVDDPLLAPAQPVVFATLAAAPATEFTVPFNVDRLVVSTNGRYVALASEDRQERMRVHAGPSGGPLNEFDASEAGFVDESRLLLLERQRTTDVLRLIDLRQGNREIWSRPIPLSSGRLLFSRHSQQWHILGWNDSGNLASVAGRIGEDAVSEQQWTSADAEQAALEPLAVSGGRVIAVETRFLSADRSAGVLQLWAVAMTQPLSRSESQLWSIGPQGRTPLTTSRLPLDCRTMLLDEPFTCASFDGTRTAFFAVDSSTGHLTVEGSVPGRFYLRDGGDGGWLSGWLDSTLVLIKPSTREGIRISRRRGVRSVDHTAAATEEMIGTVSSDVHGSTIRLYPIESQRRDSPY